jgi:hypothetical protein
MPPNTDFNLYEVRPLDGRRDYGFEQFCVQLAARESVPAGSRFFRIQGAGGDGGVECYWQLPDGSKWGWQAKFLNRLDRRQINDSVTTALRIHPELKRYFICLPFDLTGPTGRPGQDQWTLWDKWATDWQAVARNRDMDVQFEPWTKSTLLDRLLDIDKDGGRRRFWFDAESFNVDWFRRHLNEVTCDAGPRYHRELNVEVPISETFAAFGTAPSWLRRRLRSLRDLETEVERWAQRARERPEAQAPAMTAAAPLLQEAVSRLHSFWGDDWSERGRLEACEALARAREAAAAAVGALRDELAAKYGPNTVHSAAFRQFHAEYQCSFPAEDFDRAEDVRRRLHEEDDLLRSPAVEAQETALLVIGAAGVGKTHAICDTARQRLEEGLLSIVVLGDKLTHGDVLDQVRQRLGLQATLSRDALLTALDAAGEASGAPLLLFIDALNERNPRTAWKSDLASLVEQIRRFANLRLCLSCRTTYLDAVLPDGLALLQEEHQGFSGVEYEATMDFFTHWNLPPPSVPLLQPEYANPLFLRMLCEGLASSDRHAINDCPLALSEVVALLMARAERTAEQALDVDRRGQLVQRSVHTLVTEMAQAGTLRLRWAKASELVNGLLPERTRSRSLLDFLLSEGILTEGGSGRTADEIRFGFERLGEFLVATHLTEQAQTADDLRRVIADSPIFAPSAEGADGDAAGLLEALAIILPERFGSELVDLGLDIPRKSLLLATANSLAWRTPQSLTPATQRALREALANPEVFALALEGALGLAARANHPLGFDFIDDVLRPRPQAERDATFCWFLHHSWERNGAARRLSHWALKPELGRPSEETALAWSAALAWLCTAADRRVRDQATMGMVALLAQAPGAASRLIDLMLDVNDDYVVERVLLAAYGALLRSGDVTAIRVSAASVYKRLFATSPPQNALIRDLGRCIVELAAARGVLPEDLAIERAPYGSVLPSGLVKPRGGDSARAKSRGSRTEEPAEPNEGRTWRSIRQSVEDDDFAVYTMESALNIGQRPSLDVPACKRWLYEELRRLGAGAEFDQYDDYMVQIYGPGRGRPQWAERLGKKYQWIALYRLVGLVEDNVELVRDSWGPNLPPDAPTRLQAPGERNLDPTVLVRQPATDRHAVSWWAPLRPYFRPDLQPVEWLDSMEFPDSRTLIEVTDLQGIAWLVLHSDLRWDDRSDLYGYDVESRQISLWLRSFVVPVKETDRAWRWLGREERGSRELPKGPWWLSYVFAGEYPWASQARRMLAEAAAGGDQDGATPPLTPSAFDLPLEFEFDAYHEETIHLLVPAPIFFDAEQLCWDGEGGYRDHCDQLVFRAPNMHERGPKGLLVRRDGFLSWLEARGLQVIWRTNAELQWLPGRIGSSHPLGYAAQSRCHRIVGGKLQSSRAVNERRRPAIIETEEDPTST